mgnify:CR=1 FL=1
MDDPRLTIPKWYNEAMKYIGVSEIAGPEHNPIIVGFFEHVSYKATADEVAWCSAFMNAVFARVGMRGTGSAAAASWLFWGRRLDKPKAACVVVLKRGNTIALDYQNLRPGMDRYPPAHVGLYVGPGADGTIRVIGGNQGNAVRVSVFRERDVLAYRWPAEDGDVA